MAQVTITIPPADVPDAMAAFCGYANLTPVNAANAQLGLVQIAKDAVRDYRRAVAAAAATAPVVPPDIS